MNKEIEKYINDEVQKFRKELTSKVDAMLEKENQPKTVWDIEREDVYYVIYPRGIEYFVFHGEDFDNSVRDMGNMFLTQEEAEFELERRKIEAVMKKFSVPFESEKCNWIISYDHFNNTVDVTYWCNDDYGVYYFETREIARKVIDEVGEDRLLKY
ncbi:hypothetical protein [Peptostreptococcus sp. D1]|uniref:hypothetical protein n=1 Tax=Peptostreptococcus sp. D1 TaxID=72304 RepID=UPI0008EB7F6A|nr:hypothetical protein [Peptostreptococcus sp. D1]SFE89936.1 hypothetical protein SAMN02910278_02003 [Peptostreptococcus sp. D1]